MGDRMVWSAPDGTVIDLTDRASGYIQTSEGTTGLRSPGYTVSARQFAGADGAVVDSIRADVGQPSIAMFVQAPDQAQFRAKARALVRAMRPKAGIGTLTVTPDVGEPRSLDCYCIGGLEGDQSAAVSGSQTWWRFVLKLYAPSPWWRLPSRTLDFGLGAPTPFFPIFPLVLSPSNVQGQLTVDLTDADADTPPRWEIVGPGTALTLTKLNTGEVIQVNAPVGDGQSYFIDTRPGMQSVRRSDGTNLMGSVASDPALWTLAPGVNQVSALLTGANSSSRIRGTYDPLVSGT